MTCAEHWKYNSNKKDTALWSQQQEDKHAMSRIVLDADITGNENDRKSLCTLGRWPEKEFSRVGNYFK